MSDYHRIEVVDSEKSPKLLMTNFKEQMVLDKNIHMLDKSKKIVMNRIKIDQRVLYKRFQKKLNQSKLFHAQITGNKESEKELLRRNSLSLNTDVGVKDDSDDVLKKIWQVSERIEMRKGSNCERKTRTKSAGPMLDRKTYERRDTSPGEMCAPEGWGQHGRPHSNVTIANYSPSKRPATAFVTKTVIGTHQQSSLVDKADDGESMFGLEHTTAPTESRQSSGTVSIVRRANEDYLQYIMDDLDELSIAGKYQNMLREKHQMEQKDKLDRQVSLNIANDKHHKTQRRITFARPETAPTSYHRLSMAQSPFQRPTLFHPQSAPLQNMVRRKCSSKQASKKRSIFDVSTQPTLLDLHKERVQSANFDKQVKNFCKEIEPHKAECDHTTDYYTVRLLQNSGARSTVDRPLQSPTDDKVLRHYFIKTRSLTFKRLDTSFHNRPNSGITP